MKILAGATFERCEKHHDEEHKFIVFGPITKEAWVERWYAFRDSKKRYPDIRIRFSEGEGETIVENQRQDPVLIWQAGPKRIFLFKDVFVKCETEIETIEVVRGLVLEKLEREAKRIERLRKKGSVTQ